VRPRRTRLRVRGAVVRWTRCGGLRPPSDLPAVPGGLDARAIPMPCGGCLRRRRDRAPAAARQSAAAARARRSWSPSRFGNGVVAGPVRWQRLGPRCAARRHVGLLPSQLRGDAARRTVDFWEARPRRRHLRQRMRDPRLPRGALAA
jgi:hypothetical protein